jgi:type VI secretion system protein ImpE
MTSAAATELIKQGRARQALDELQAAVRANPSDSKLRVFLFQLLCVLGQWERAATQLNLVADMDAKAVLMKQMYGDALACEALRGKVFAGEKAPMVFGYPEEWLALMIEALLNKAHAARLRERALELAPASGGTVDGQAFEWIADADSRIGPVLEAVIKNRYYWVPFQHLQQIDIEPPEDLRDCVWMPAHLTFTNGGETLALIPTRYAGTEASDDDLLRMARKTEWNETEPGVYCGLGQRVFATDAGEYALMDVRSIVLNHPEPAGDAAPAA